MMQSQHVPSHMDFDLQQSPEEKAYKLQFPLFSEAYNLCLQ